MLGIRISNLIEPIKPKVDGPPAVQVTPRAVKVVPRPAKQAWPVAQGERKEVVHEEKVEPKKKGLSRLWPFKKKKKVEEEEGQIRVITGEARRDAF